MDYVAFLRGINLGNRRIKMADLRSDFEDWGFSRVRSALASGNLAFESELGSVEEVQARIEQGFEDKHAWEVPTCVRPAEAIRELVASQPFAEVPEEHNQYITFLPNPPEAKIELPYQSVEGDYRILEVHPGYVVSALDRSRGSGTLDAMAVLEELFGESITTRTWKTVLKVHALLEDQ